MTTFQPPNAIVAAALGITRGPVTADQAKLTAAAAAGGIAQQAEAQDEDRTQVFGVVVQTATTVKNVKVRIADGAVTKIDEGGPDSETSTEGGSN